MALKNPALPFPLKLTGSAQFETKFITPVKGHQMHLHVSHNVKTLLSALHRNAITLMMPFRKPSNQNALHLLLQHAADL